jgi:5-methylcytosine-specific restriction endonuclease McrA
MTKTTIDFPLFWQRTQDWFNAFKRQARAAGTCLTYRLEDLRTLVEKQLARPYCPYCQGPFTLATMALTHKTPIVRGGKFTYRNLEVCCPDCHLLRGVLDAQEYRELRLLIATWPRPVQTRFLAGLKTAQSLAQPDLPRVGALEWFTDGDEGDAPSRTDPRGYKSILLSEVSDHEVSHG